MRAPIGHDNLSPESAGPAAGDACYPEL